jgi:4-hydroxy-2-oxoheptanedioate aldolase
VAAARAIIGSIQEWEGNYEEKLLVAMIESREALANLPDLLKLKEIDVFYLGAVDLALSMGHRGHRKHPAVQAAVEDAIKRIADAGRPSGMNVQDDLEATNRYIGMGLRWVNVHLKVFMQRGIQAFLQGMGQQTGAQRARVH